jgi:HK97 family phage prohead protease
MHLLTARTVEMETLRELDVVRAVAPDDLEVRSDDDAAMPTLVSRFSPFDTWYEIDSMFEGRFLERTVKGAFRKTIRENGANVKVLFDHGYDTQIGNKVLGPIASLREAKDSAVGEVPLFDTSYNRDLLPGLEAGVYGSSFRFRVIRDEWNDEPGKSEFNRDGIPERTIKEVRLFEFGPVTFPANPTATAGVRCLTDNYYERARARDPQVEGLLARARALRTPDAGTAPAGTPADGAAQIVVDAPPSGTRGLSPDERAALLRGLELLELS